MVSQHKTGEYRRLEGAAAIGSLLSDSSSSSNISQSLFYRRKEETRKETFLFCVAAHSTGETDTEFHLCVADVSESSESSEISGLEAEPTSTVDKASKRELTIPLEDEVTAISINAKDRILSLAMRNLSCLVFSLDQLMEKFDEKNTLITSTSATSSSDNEVVERSTIRAGGGIHEGPILVLDSLDLEAQILVATGGADSTIKIWDAKAGFVTHNLTGHKGIISALKFCPLPHSSSKASKTKDILLASASDDCSIRIWNLRASNATSRKGGKGGSVGQTLWVFQGHTSVVTSLAWALDDKRSLWSGGRDGVLTKWDCTSSTEEEDRNRSREEVSVVVGEVISSLAHIPSVKKGEDGVVVVGGSQGLLRSYESNGGNLIQIQKGREGESEGEVEGREVEDIQYLGEGEVVVRNGEGDFSFFETSSNGVGKRRRILGGQLSQILDLCILPPPPFGGMDPKKVAVVSNSKYIRIYDIQGKGCQVLDNYNDLDEEREVFYHKDMIICVVCSEDGKFLATGSKDSTCIVWQKGEDNSWKSIWKLVGHTGTVSALCFTKVPKGGKGISTLFTASNDRTLKAWNLETGKTRWTIQAHEGDIQGIDVSSNNSLVSTCSLDKTIRVWDVQSGSSVSPPLKGHKRGVWSCKFSPVDQALVSCSTDKTVKIWSIYKGKGEDGESSSYEFKCVRTLEGHLNSVLRVLWINGGTRVVSSGGDGLIKVWDCKSGECVGTFDGHEDRVWALDVANDGDMLISGSADAALCVWRDATLLIREEEEKKEEKRITIEQDMQIFLRRSDYKNAIILALQLDQPLRILKILTTCTKEGKDSEKVTGSSEVDEYFQGLSLGDLGRMLEYIRGWNTSTTHSHLAQKVLYLILSSTPPERLMKVKGIKGVTEALVAYGERHFAHTGERLRDGYLVDYTLERMETLLI